MMTQAINQAAGRLLTTPNINIPINQAGQPLTTPNINIPINQAGQPLMLQNVNLPINPTVGQPLIFQNDNIHVTSSFDNLTAEERFKILTEGSDPFLSKQ
ncbi:hypothetical protein C2G38_2156574 [Gigaspora rosea]|uniref:Uncharacterized protein n=1 Tax=Gigaspora rosea TaxID=44941 RepID=A0A397WB39_9GLOM|nr:hypothetical protein C2G38_2156574 [Gigaspora rosea]